MKTIREVIQTIVEKLSDRNGYKKAWLERHWAELVGEEAGKHSRPYKIERDILFVSVDSSVWNQELFMKRASLIAVINRKFARKIVEAIKYQMGHFSVASEGMTQPGLELLEKVTDPGAVRTASWDKNIMHRLQQKKEKLDAGKKGNFQ